MKILNLSDKIASFGSLISAMGCASCFPLIASFAATLGFGFLAQFEALFINQLLPIFACIIIGSNFLVWLSQRHLARFIFSVIGPVMVLATLYLYWTTTWSTYMFYIGLVLMLVNSIFNIKYPITSQQQIK